MKKYNVDATRKNTRCGHHWCTDCRKRKGRNWGNRILRRQIKQTLHDEKRAS